MLEIASLPVVDVHCHPFPPPEPLAVEAFVDQASFPGGGVDYLLEAGGPSDPAALQAEVQQLRRNLVYFRSLVRELATFFGCEPRLEAVVEARNAALRAEADYLSRLFAACGLQTLVVDFGYPQPPLDPAAFARRVPAQVVPVYRIEPLIAELLAEDIGWEEFRRRYDERLAWALQEGGYRGLKSIIAYRTGLDISPLSRSPDQGLRALDAYRRGIGGEAMKQLRDHLFCRALEICMEHDVPMQVHTGVGDYEVNLTRCRPALLMDLLRFPVFRTCKVILVHTGYPYHAEAGYMANVLPRVYCDVSEGVPFAGGAARRIFAEVLEMAPLHKVLYGSDGFNLPEVFYVSAVLGKRALAGALEDLVEGGLLSRQEAEEAAGWILAENARRLYGIL